MSNTYLTLWCDPSANKVYSGWNRNTQLGLPVLKQGDKIGVELHWVSSSGFTSQMYETEFPPSATARMALGRIDAPALGGTFTITYGADTTDPLPYDIEATALQTALNGLDSIDAEGGVTVNKSGSQFRVYWNTAGLFATELSVDAEMLFPKMDSDVISVRAGSSTSNRVLFLKLKQAAIAATTSFTTVEQPSIVVTSLFTSTWRLSISPSPKDGVFSVTLEKGVTTYITKPIKFDASAADVATELNSLNAVTGQTFTVVKSGDYIWDITAPSAIDTITAASALVGFSALYGVLDINTAEVEEFLAGAKEGLATLEIELDADGNTNTLAQINVKILNDLIDASSFSIVSMGSVMPVDSVVRYDTSQSLTAPQKATARLNIGAVTLSEVTDSVDLDNIPTVNEKNAMQNSVLPSTTNPFVTMSQRNPFNQSLNMTDTVEFKFVLTTDRDVPEGDPPAFSVLSPYYLNFNNIDVLTQTDLWLTSSESSLYIDNYGIRFNDGTIQTTAYQGPVGGTFLLKASNLSDLANVSTARTNLGLGTMATATAADYLTVTNASTTYLSKAANLSGLTDVPVARTNLGLGTMAVAATADYLAKAGNLSGISDTATARTNIGLGALNSPQFSVVNLGGTSGNYSSASATAISTFSTTGQFVTIQPSGITANSTDGLSITIPSTSDTAKVAKNGTFNGEKGIWYGDNSSQTGITKAGVRYPDGTLQTTATSDPEFNRSLVFIDCTSFSGYSAYNEFGTGINSLSAYNADMPEHIEQVGPPYDNAEEWNIIPLSTLISPYTAYGNYFYSTTVGGQATIFTKRIKDKNFIRLISASYGEGFLLMNEVVNPFSDRDVSYTVIPSTETPLNALSGSITGNILRMDKAWKIAFSVTMKTSINDESPTVPYESSPVAFDSEEGTFPSQHASYGFGLNGGIVIKGFGTIDGLVPAATMDGYKMGCGRLYYNRYNQQLYFRYPKTQRGLGTVYPNTYILPDTGEASFTIPPELESRFYNGDISMDVEIYNFANGTLNQDNSNQMRCRLTIWSLNETSSTVLELDVNDAASPIELEDEDGTILCGVEAQALLELKAGIVSIIGMQYIDIQMANPKFAYLDQ